MKPDYTYSTTCGQFFHLFANFAQASSPILFAVTGSAVTEVDAEDVVSSGKQVAEYCHRALTAAIDIASPDFEIDEDLTDYS